MDPLNNVLRSLPARLDADDAAQLAWGLAAGGSLAARTRIETRPGGVWRIQVTAEEGQLAEAETRRQIASVLPELLEALQRMLGPGVVKRLQLEGQAPRKPAAAAMGAWRRK